MSTGAAGSAGFDEVLLVGRGPKEVSILKAVTVTIDRDRCKGCELCISFCPADVLALSDRDFNAAGYRPAVVARAEACTGCAHCARMCPEAAISITVLRPATPVAG